MKLSGVLVGIALVIPLPLVGSGVAVASSEDCEADPKCEVVPVVEKKAKGNGNQGNTVVVSQDTALTDSLSVSYGTAYNENSFGPPEPGPTIDKMKSCAKAHPNIFDDVAKEGTVTLSYGQSANPLLVGEAGWGGGSVHITIYRENIASLAPNPYDYWVHFAVTVLHEYNHALDMHLCECNNPYDAEVPPMDEDAYEELTENVAWLDFDRLYGGNPSCFAD